MAYKATQEDLLCDLCGGSGLVEHAIPELSGYRQRCPKCGGHGFDPELVEAVETRIIQMIGKTPRVVTTVVLSVVRERLER